MEILEEKSRVATGSPLFTNRIHKDSKHRLKDLQAKPQNEILSRSTLLKKIQYRWSNYIFVLHLQTWPSPKEI